MLTESEEKMSTFYKLTVFLALLTVLIYVNRASGSPKIDCHPLEGASKERCESLGCVWKPVERPPTRPLDVPAYGESLGYEGTFDVEISKTSRVDEPWCTYPADYVGYEVDVKENNTHATLKRRTHSGVPDDIQELEVDISTYGSSLRVRIADANNKRFEPEIPVLTPYQKPGLDVSRKHDLVGLISSSGRLSVIRKSTNTLLFDTDLKKLIFADKFIQISSILDSPFVYGLGEHYDTFLKYANAYKVYSFYHTDRLPLPSGTRSYGSFPFYVNLDSPNQSHAHGVYLRNSNAMDIILQPDSTITFRTIGGILDFIFFDGPTPNDVIVEYQNTVGLPDLPPVWSLGFHLCRYDYLSSERTIEVNRRNREAGVPVEVQWNDIDYMDRHNDFTYDHVKYATLPKFIESLHKDELHYMLLFDPGVSQESNYRPYELGAEMGIFVRNATNQTLVGKVWNDSGRTVFPDFSNPKSHEYWRIMFQEFHKDIQYDGAWLDMNDISSFVNGSLDGCPQNDPVENPVYLPGGYFLQKNTLCLSAKHMAGLEYDVHNLYSFYETIASHKALLATRPNRRSLIISRSTTVGQGKYGGHWNGDLEATWDYMKWTIPSLIEHSMYGYSMMGADICGFVGNTTVELCARWSTLGAFYTFSRNHNSDIDIDQDPVALGPVVVEANINAYRRKYSLIPFAYTLITQANKFGTPVVRAVPFVFHGDKEALKVEYQFMWGDILMISPIVDPGTTTKRTYLPAGRWFETNIRPESPSNIPKMIESTGEWYESRDIGLSDLLIFHRGGHIVPAYASAKQSVAETVKQPLRLEIAFGSNNIAEGELYMADGYKIDGNYTQAKFHAEGHKLQVHVLSESIWLSEIRVMPVSFEVKSVKWHEIPEAEFKIEQNEHLLKITLNRMYLRKGSATFEWS